MKIAVQTVAAAWPAASLESPLMFATSAAMPFSPLISFRLCASWIRTTYPERAAGLDGLLAAVRVSSTVLVVTIQRPSGENCTVLKVSFSFPGWLVNSVACGTSHNRRPRSAHVVTARRPSAERERDDTASGCRRFSATSDFPVATSHCTTV